MIEHFEKCFREALTRVYTAKRKKDMLAKMTPKQRAYFNEILSLIKEKGNERLGKRNRVQKKYFRVKEGM